MKTVLVDEKKQIRFSDWTSNDVSILTTLIPFVLRYFCLSFDAVKCVSVSVIWNPALTPRVYANVAVASIY